MISVTFLGTSDSVPSEKRNHTALLLNYKGENILIDCGEGTQRQFRKAKLNPCKITRILLTHKHADHSLGIPGLLKTLELSGYGKTLYIYGPKGIKNFINGLFDAFGNVKEYKIEVKEVSGKFFEADDFYLEAESMTHNVPCNAYSFVKKGQIRIDKKKLEKAKIPHGPILQKLKLGKDIVHDGKKYRAKDLTYNEDGKKISFIFDTSLNEKISDFVKDADLLISESSFSSDLKERAKDYHHLTSEQAAETAKKAKVKKLILTHISQRYERKMKQILSEARKIFKNSFLVEDLDVVRV
jgi:ribonuclease Z